MNFVCSQLPYFNQIAILTVCDAHLVAKNYGKQSGLLLIKAFCLLANIQVQMNLDQKKIGACQFAFAKFH